MTLLKRSNHRLFSLLGLLCVIGFLTVALVPLVPPTDGTERLTRLHSYKSRIVLPPSHGTEQQVALPDQYSITYILLVSALLPVLLSCCTVNPSPKAELFKMLLSLYKRKANYVPLQA